MKIHINDCSSLWQEYIESAETSIIVFTPYFDQMLINLFSKGEVPYNAISLVTQLDRIDDRSENLARLDRLVDLMNLGINVKILDRLHAKILIVDETYAFFGSQNFTNFSKDSIEISAEIDRYVDNGVEKFFNYFENLLQKARVSTIAEINLAAGYERFAVSDSNSFINESLSSLEDFEYDED